MIICPCYLENGSNTNEKWSYLANVSAHFLNNLTVNFLKIMLRKVKIVTSKDGQYCVKSYYQLKFVVISKDTVVFLTVFQLPRCDHWF